MPRTVQDIIDHADELAKRFENYEPAAEEARDPQAFVALRDAVITRSEAERSGQGRRRPRPRTLLLVGAHRLPARNHGRSHPPAVRCQARGIEPLSLARWPIGNRTPVSRVHEVLRHDI